MKNILLPTDFSENALNAIRFAIELYKEESCTFHLLNTYTPSIVHSRYLATTTEGTPLEDTIRSDSQKRLKQLLDQIQKSSPNPQHNFHTISSFNLLTEEIKQSIEPYKIEMVIMGTKGSSGLEGTFMGSNTLRVIKTIDHCPILAIPAAYTFEKPADIAFATDFKRSINAKAISPLIHLATAFKSIIRVLHINEERSLDPFQETNREALIAHFGNIENTYHWMPNFASKTEIINHFLEDVGSNLLVLVHHKHSILEKLLREPVINRIVGYPRIPLLIIPE